MVHLNGRFRSCSEMLLTKLEVVEWSLNGYTLAVKWELFFFVDRTDYFG